MRREFVEWAVFALTVASLVSLLHHVGDIHMRLEAAERELTELAELKLAETVRLAREAALLAQCNITEQGGYIVYGAAVLCYTSHGIYILEGPPK